MEIKKTLLCAVDLLEQKGWTQGAFAQDVEGCIVSPMDPRAVCFCTLGAISKCGDDNYRAAAVTVSKWLRQNYAGVNGIVDWNDARGRTKEEVVAALRAAAASCAP